MTRKRTAQQGERGWETAGGGGNYSWVGGGSELDVGGLLLDGDLGLWCARSGFCWDRVDGLNQSRTRKWLMRSLDRAEILKVTGRLEQALLAACCCPLGELVAERMAEVVAVHTVLASGEKVPWVAAEEEEEVPAQSFVVASDTVSEEAL